MKPQINNAINKKKGFSLVETLVAVFILSMAIAGAMSAAHIGLSSAMIARDQVSAYFLASEAIDYVRNVRDDNIGESATAWLPGLGACTYTEGSMVKTCKIDVITKSVATCSLTADCVLNFDASGDVDGHGFYNYQHGTPSKFSRTISIEQRTVDGNANEEAHIIVTVSWRATTGQDRSVVITDNLYYLAQ